MTGKDAEGNNAPVAESPPTIPVSHESVWQRIGRSFFILVGLPTLFAALYYGLAASDIYVSETRFAIRTSEQAPTSGLLTAVFGVGAASRASDDAAIIRDYILSLDMLRQLDSKYDLRDHYTSKAIDGLSRMRSDVRREEFLEYYRRMVEVTIDTATGIMVLKVRAFSSEIAQEIAQALLERSEELVNQLSDRISRDTLEFAESEADKAEQKIRAASAAITQFRNKSRSVDPGEETSAVLGIITKLEGGLAAARAELSQAQSFMRADSSQVKTLRSKVAALERQVDIERQRLASESDTDLTRLIQGYEPLLLEQQLAEQRYTSTLTSLELARAEAQRKQRYLVAFVPPALPDEAVEPERARKMLTFFVCATLIFAIGGLVVAAVNDHWGV